MTFIVVDTDRPGAGPTLHRHPYTETFIVLEGDVVFEVDDERVPAASGSVVVVPANTPHRFENVGPGRLLQVNIHTSPRFETEWLTD